MLAPLAAVEMMGRETVDWPSVSALGVATLGLGALALRHVMRHPAPILAVDGFRVRSFAVSMLGGSLFRIAVSAVPFLLPLMFQVGFGIDAFQSGLLVLVLFVGNVAMKPMTSGVLRRFGFKAVLVGDCCLAALAILALTVLTPDTPLVVTLPALAVAGMTRSMGLTTVNTLAFSEIAPDAMGGANTMFNMFQQVSFGLGVAVGALALRVAELWRPSGAAHATPTEFRIAFALVSLVAFAAALDALRLPVDAGAEVTRG